MIATLILAAVIAAPPLEKSIIAGRDGMPKTASSGVKMPLVGDKVVVFRTNHGDIWMRMFPDIAPKHVENFLELSENGFYKGVRFHRVIPGFMIQGGDPNSKDDDRSNDGTGGYTVNGRERTLTAEFNAIKHTPGVVSMARSQNPNSASSQFFIMVANSPHLDGQYSAFGQVFSGMDAVNKIVNLPRDRNDNPLKENPAIIEESLVVMWDNKYLSMEGQR
ncbi:MAG: peptidylprolyl isomerase [Fimbriimonadaceae bacterium]|nr:peptidylprolyl isomerase [Fimbriimonadaceae bacterium]